MNKDNEIQLLTVDEQIELLSEVRKRLFNGVPEGVCVLIVSIALEFYGISKTGCATSIFASQLIPLLRFENALQFNVMETTQYLRYWWKIIPFDSTNRIAFVDWMLSELNKQKQNQDDKQDKKVQEAD